MSGYDHEPAPVACAGCDEPTPYAASYGPEAPSFGEFLSTPEGMTYVRTHRCRECVQSARARLRGKHRRTPTVEEQLAARP